ncbi:hypothetical protein DFJ77DRAFT_456386 [Powellomyces hirtus]|nr:hypothetical protein DFJ77DRAFT_456386 [Powellomyces hirtus]
MAATTQLLPLTADYDPRWTDVGAAHRAYMQRKLYGPARENRFLPHSNAEAGDHTSPYADIPPPKWSTTTHDEYPRKYGAPAQKIDASDPRTSHFTIGDPSMNTEPTSRSHSDFTKPEMSMREDGREIAKRDHMYPPIFRDKDALGGTDSTYAAAFPAHHPSRRRILPHTKTLTHIVLGTSGSSYTTTAGDALLPRERDTYVPVVEKLREWAPAMEDGVSEKWESTARGAYGAPQNVDYAQRGVAAGNADRSAHFTLGTSDSATSTSTTYGRSFTGHDVRAGGLAAVQVPRTKSHVLDEQDGVKWTSVYGDTYQGKKAPVVAVVKPHTLESAISFGAHTDPTLATTCSTYTAHPASHRRTPRARSPPRNPLASTDPSDQQTPQRATESHTWDPASFRDRRQVAATAAGRVRDSSVFRFADSDNVKEKPCVVVTRSDAAGVPTPKRSEGLGAFERPASPSYTTTARSTYGSFTPAEASAARGVPASKITTHHPPIPPDADGTKAVSVTTASHVEPVRMRYMKPIWGL